MIKTFYPSSESELRLCLLKKRSMLFCSSQTSTVIPYAHLEKLLGHQDLDLIDLSQMSSSLELLNGEILRVKGHVTWKDAQDFCKQKGRSLLAWPTETSAACLAGIATSATGEKSFGNGPLSSHLVNIVYLDYRGERKTLSASQPLLLNGRDDLLKKYQEEFAPYIEFKNGPFPRFDREIDLMIGTEGQLGVIVEADFKTVPLAAYTYMFLKLPRWEDDDRPHLDLVKKVQSFRGHIQGCEFLDSQCLAFLEKEERPFDHADMVSLEIKTSSFEHVHENFLSKLMVSENDMFEIEESKFLRLRLRVPQRIFEENSRRGITKKGTDIQVPVEQMKALFSAYREATSMGIAYGLFGHIGDRHLHFNFMPNHQQEQSVDDFLKNLYAEAKSWHASPFAEHSIGLLKRPFIFPYHGPIQRQVFQLLKNIHDPDGVFFPQGFMGNK